MSIYSSAVKKPITTSMVFLAVIILGLYSLTKLPIDFYPEVEFPAISVITTYPGAGAGDIETNITRPLEDGFNSLSNLKKLHSTSRENISVVTLEFEWGVNIDEATNDVRNALEFSKRRLPDDAEQPMIFKFNSSLMPIMFFSVKSEESYVGIEKLLDERLVNRLNRIDGIGQVGVMGSPKRVVYIDIDPRKLESYNLTIEMIGGIVAAENINLPSGKIEMGLMDYQLKVEGEFSRSEQIKDVPVGSFMGQTIYINDIATVRDTVKDMTIFERADGLNATRMMIMKQSGGNTVAVAKAVREQLVEIQKTLPKDIKVIPIFDSSEFISTSVRNLSETLLYALLFVILVILFFLGRWRATFIVVITIPISLIVSFIYLQLSGNTINIISLASLSIAIGMVVDDAIVVLENITRHIERGSTPREAALHATNEVWLAVIVTTLVVLAVFIPLTFVSGITGVMFRQLGWIVSIVITTSTIAAISLTPMMSSLLLRLRPEKEKKSFYDRTIKVWLDKLDNFYARTIKWSLRHKTVVLFSALAIFVGSLFLIPFLGTEFMPESDESRVSIFAELQTGTRVDETAKIVKQIEDIIEERYPETRLVSSSYGADDQAGVSSIFGSAGSHIINIQMRLVKPHERKRTCWEIGDDIREQLKQIPEIVNYTIGFGGGFGGGGGGNNIDVEIYGYDFEVTNKIANELSERIKKIEGARDVSISREKSKPELKVVLDRDKLSQFGLNTATVSMAMRNRVQGMIATKYREKGEEYDIIVRLEEDFRNSITDIENISFTNSQGQQIRLTEIGEVQEHWSPPNIERLNRERIVKVTCKPYKTSMGDLAKNIQKEIDQVEVSGDVIIEVGGAYKDQQESFADLGLLMILSLTLVYIVMASQFESFRMPLIIMFSIPFSFTGVILALFITGIPLSVIAALGAILLIGIVVKNGIVLVDFINLMRDRGVPLYQAIEEAGRSRLRPVLMTAFTTILGLLPMALSTGEGSEIWSPMGISVMGGLVFSTIITMIIIPVAYAIFTNKGERSEIKTKHLAAYNFMDDENDVK
ncbi:MAG: efflux RND transporter permease subunit [Bacteroidales bacterium]|jgi:HAE1 family hydrophobic/amphiphilic exporter-1|nr:efflux RND transporter permease subunit [Bacteroidales bacterium]